MNEFKSTLTSKGQITLPKTIRDVMNLNTGDQVNFTVQPNKQVVMEKADLSVKSQAKMNLLSLLLGKDLPIVIKGRSGIGKTYFVKKFLSNQFINKKVAIIEPIDTGYNQLNEEYTADITSFVSFDIDVVIPKIIDNKYELVVVEEVLFYDFNSIKKLFHNKQKLILISQEFDQHELLEIGSHFSIFIDIGGIIIKQYELLNDSFEIKTIFVD